MNELDVPSLDLLRQQCKALCLPTAYQVVGHALDTARREAWPLETFLHHLLEQELAGRRQRRAARRIKESHLPAGKTLSTFDQQRLPLRVRQWLPQLCRGELIDRAENVLIFGLPGTGKTHLAAALGYEWIDANRSVLFTPTYQLVGRLLRAKRDLELERELRRLDRFQVVILDDIGYVQQSRERDGGAVHFSRRAVRTPQCRDHLQPRLLRMGSDLQGPLDHRSRDRPRGPPQLDHRIRCRHPQLPGGSSDQAQPEKGTGR